MHDSDPRVPSREALGYLAGTVAGTIIDHDNLGRLDALPRETRQTGLKEAFLVTHGHDENILAAGLRIFIAHTGGVLRSRT